MSLTVRLAGYNIDADLIESVIGLLRDLERDGSEAGFGNLSANEYRVLLESLVERARSGMNPEAFTPETISAAYARISRDPKPVTELRKAARFAVSRARKSNENIIFGLGHASVAEHAFFNFDILGLSRLASEELQSHRLLSFTEKSQRYISLSTDYIIPPELIATSWESRLNTDIPQLFTIYKNMLDMLIEKYQKEINHEPTREELRDLENRAKEDARYLLPLACTTQMGVSMNARNVEYITRDFSDHPLQELRNLSQGISNAVSGLAPSLIKYTSRGTYPRQNRETIKEIHPSSRDNREVDYVSEPAVRLLDWTSDGEEKVLSALAFSLGTGNTSVENNLKVWHEIFRNILPHDGAMREFEVAQMAFEADISASCFAQLKRHRMMTLLHEPYLVDSTVVIPPSIHEAGLTKEFKDSVQSAVRLAAELSERSPLLAPYLLTNAHMKRVRIHINARELYHFARLRSDLHAQWEVRKLSDRMLELARTKWPNLLALAVGKHEFEEHYRHFFSS